MPVDVIVPIDTVDEIRVFKDTVVVESFGVDAHTSFCLNTWGKSLSQVRHLKPLSVGERPTTTTPPQESKTKSTLF